MAKESCFNCTAGSKRQQAPRCAPVCAAVVVVGHVDKRDHDGERLAPVPHAHVASGNLRACMAVMSGGRREGASWSSQKTLLSCAKLSCLALRNQPANAGGFQHSQHWSLTVVVAAVRLASVNPSFNSSRPFFALRASKLQRRWVGSFSWLGTEAVQADQSSRAPSLCQPPTNHAPVHCGVGLEVGHSTHLLRSSWFLRAWFSRTPGGWVAVCLPTNTHSHVHFICCFCFCCFFHSRLEKPFKQNSTHRRRGANEMHILPRHRVGVQRQRLPGRRRPQHRQRGEPGAVAAAGVGSLAQELEAEVSEVGVGGGEPGVGGKGGGVVRVVGFSDCVQGCVQGCGIEGRCVVVINSCSNKQRWRRSRRPEVRATRHAPDRCGQRDLGDDITRAQVARGVGAARAVAGPHGHVSLPFLFWEEGRRVAQRLLRVEHCRALQRWAKLGQRPNNDNTGFCNTDRYTLTSMPCVRTQFKNAASAAVCCCGAAEAATAAVHQVSDTARTAAASACLVYNCAILKLARYQLLLRKGRLWSSWCTCCCSLFELIYRTTARDVWWQCTSIPATIMPIET